MTAKRSGKFSSVGWSAANEEESVMVVTQFIEHTIVAILHARSIFPSNCFQMKDIGGDFELPCIKSNILQEPGTKAVAIQSWVRQGLYPAIAKRYLKSAIFIVADDQQRSREQYAFRLSYPSVDSIEISMNAPQGQSYGSNAPIFGQLKRVWDDLTLLASGLPRLNEETRIVTMKLSYTSIAPPGYNPPHFTGCAADAYRFAKSGPVATMAVGDVLTGDFHKCTLVYKGPPFDIAESMHSIDQANSLSAEADREADADDEVMEEDDDDETHDSAGPETLQAYAEQVKEAQYNFAREKRSISVLQPSKESQYSYSYKRPRVKVADGAEYHIVSSQESQATATFKRYAGCKEPISFTQPDY